VESTLLEFTSSMSQIFKFIVLQAKICDGPLLFFQAFIHAAESSFWFKFQTLRT